MKKDSRFLALASGLVLASVVLILIAPDWMQRFGSQLIATAALVLSLWAAVFKKPPIPKRNYNLSIHKLTTYYDNGFHLLVRISNTGEVKVNIKPEWFDIQYKSGFRFEVNEVRDAYHKKINKTVPVEPASDVEIILEFNNHANWSEIDSLLSEAQAKKDTRIASDLKEAQGKLVYSDGTNKMQEVHPWPFGVYLLQILEERSRE